jgi:glycosyltransferase involved in cell wall biosynthesis
MNIIILGSAHPYRAGGITSFNERLARQLQQEGHQVIIYNFTYYYPGFLFPGTTQFSSEPAPTDIVIERRIHSINPLNWWLVGNRLRKLKPNLVVVRYWLPVMGLSLGTILRRVKKNNHTKVICIADNVIPHEKRPGDKMFTRYFMKPVNAFITMSDKVTADLRTFEKAKPALQVNHPLYDNFGTAVSVAEARQHLHLSPEKKVVLFFGFIRHYKGLDMLLDAAKILREKGLVSFSILIAGEFFEDAKPYHEQILRNGIVDVLELHTHFIPMDEVKYYMCAADVVVQPYRSATQSGVTPLAYHFEVPMIVTNVGGLAALVPDGKVGYVAEPNATSIAEKILAFFEKGKDYFLPALKEEKKKYAWENLTNAIYSLLH